ncbi:WXG100 family type VII secretion target [Microbacterium testaceum]|uniref:WXG100 family type VII secretion target n=1 Tax=Microbacterium testaceum TaxID=2033 RepID=UPI002AC71A7A|nr:WXG100 family type VII secretion target [Microbacterium testaceum]MDZ5144194.1 WXG100 family type VII secretion target [Microbacterium testaceum]
MTIFSIKPDSLIDTASSIDAAAHRIASETATLSSARDALLGAWKGEAATSYAAKQTTWLNDVTHMVDVGRTAAEAARVAAQAYRDADDAVARAWSL